MFGGKCAYCGNELQSGWHVDHIDPVIRKTRTVPAHWRHEETGEKIEQNELHRLREMDETEERYKWKYIQRKEVPDGFVYPELNVIENMLPACASCNINKHNGSVEDFRQMIYGFIKHLNGANTQYKLAKRYGLVQETNEKIVFYFERYQKPVNTKFENTDAITNTIANA